MGSEKPIRRLTLRQLLTQSEKCSRDLIELVKSGFLPRAADFRDLSRPVRRRSHYPTMLAVQNALRKLKEAAQQMAEMSSTLEEHLDSIRDHGNREKTSRR